MDEPAGRRSRRDGVRRLFVDTTPLRAHHDYRLLWTGQVVSGMGNQITRIALPYQVYVMTGSVAAIGLLTIVQLIPILIFSLGGGAVADAVDRRRVLIVTQLGMATCSIVLVWLALQPAPPLCGDPRRRVRRRRDRLGRSADPVVVDPAPGQRRAPPGRDRPEPAQLPGRVDRRPGDRRRAHRHGRAGRGVRGRYGAAFGASLAGPRS